MADVPQTVHELDSAYKPFPPFSAWLTATSIDTSRWDRYVAEITQAQPSADVLHKAREIAKRAAAIDTGAIEGLYDVDRGFTFTVATEAAAWEVALAAKGEDVRSLFQAQLQAYDYVLDLATKAAPLSEAAIRELHIQVCAAQSTYRVMTALGPQDHPLPKGEYKTAPNHVRTRKAENHSYAPVDMTPPGMQRFVQELRTPAFLAAHPVIQACYAHYAFVAIHPFADGNGRLARALASVFTYRAISMPIVILAEHKSTYLDALEAADTGHYQRFVDFILARALDTIVLVKESIFAADAPALRDNIAAIKHLYVTRGGYSHEEVDSAGTALLDRLTDEFKKVLATQVVAPVTTNAAAQGVSYNAKRASHRPPIKGGRGITIAVRTPVPASASVDRIFVLEVPRDAAGDDDLVLRAHPEGTDAFAARMDEVVPSVSGVLQMRMAMFAERIVADMVATLVQQAKSALDKIGR